ncbi:MAG TPA: hypothetical protein PK156_50955 [Polyangium sp.]|nr:hypothetical protein [Polyangium sp.]
MSRLAKQIVACVVSFTMFGIAGCMSADVDGFNENEEADPTMEELGVAQQDVAAINPGATHCVFETTAVSLDNEKDVRLPTRATRCFPTFSQAIEFATDGRVRLAQGATQDDANRELAALARLPSASSYVIGIEYKEFDFGGGSYTFRNANNCSNWSHWVNTMPSGWDNVISSATAHSYCTHSNHYEAPYAAGAVKDCGTSCSNIGSTMNNRTRSITWTK